MLKIIREENVHYLNWVANYFKFQNQLNFRFFKFLIIKEEDYFSFSINVLNERSGLRAFINEDFGYDKNILDFCQEYNVKCYNIGKILYNTHKKGFHIVVEQIFDYEEVIFKVSFFRYGDMVLTTELGENYSDHKKINNLLNGDIIMSKEKEEKIIGYISEELNEYDINLKNYDYYLTETGENIYELNLEHLNTKKNILIRNIQCDKNNNILKIGLNKGLVL